MPPASSIPFRLQVVLEALEKKDLPMRPDAPLAGGSNLTWLCTTPGGLAAIKVYTATFDDPYEARAHEATSVALWADTGAVPALIATAAEPYPYLVTTLVDGVHATSQDTDAVVAAISMLHAHPPGSEADRPWPRLLDGWLGATPDRLRDLGDEAAAQLAGRLLTQLAGEPHVLAHGDAAPWNVLATPAGTAVLLDPLAKVGPAAFDYARWHVTTALTDIMPGPGETLDDRSAGRARALTRALTSRLADVLTGPGAAALRAAVGLELLNRASFADPRWPAGYNTVLLEAARDLAA